MIVSWEWLHDYVPLKAPLEEAVRRLTMAGLKVESQTQVGTDWAIDVEVTSNRPDCLGHLGIARELAVLFGQPLELPNAAPAETTAKSAEVTSVVVECLDLCPQYFARVIRGVKVGPSPAWLVRRLQAIGQPSINNVVDATNYVLMECGQPLHAFDLDRLRGRRIVVRRPKPGEKIVAINQKTYDLGPDMCVIADAERPVGIGGVMGGLETEIGPTARNVLIEAANFTPLPLRNAARKLSLFSDASYRFERGIDPLQLDWASRRVCQLILELAGGELLAEPAFAGTPLPGKRPPITLRFAQVPRVLGIEVPPTESVQILSALGNQPDGPPSDEAARFIPPSWRRDLSREIDLIEEVARIHGYDAIPQNVEVPLRPSHRSLRDRVTDEVRFVFTAAGFYEAVTMAFCSDAECELFQPRGDLPRLRVEHSSRKQENVLRQSLIPGLLVSRQLNERHGTFDANLFEIAKVYLKTDFAEPESRREPPMIGFVTAHPFGDAKGIVEALAHRIVPKGSVVVKPSDVRQFAPGRGADVYLNGTLWGWLGELDRSVTEAIDLKDALTVGELDLTLLETNAQLVPQNVALAQFPAIDRDLNFVVDEAVSWEALESVVSAAAGPLLERVGFGGQYRGKQIEADKKSYVVTLSYRAPDRTLTADEIDGWQKKVINACGGRLGARLR
jgi:phenylalanyl-tRNA synthetase beta chain